MKEEILIYPNPSNSSFKIFLIGAKENKIYSGKLIELNGKILKEFSLSNTYELPIFALDPGMFIISINHNPQWSTKVFIQN
ncbi:MAG: T9SS type A sorting domain-containing protein [Saprospiraceae bacterium]|nr:T9SS type A sorting domain-containing protein [Saprospiraceae bacterium]MBK8451042.1 T9SS type A sorting domain-containing protein [Saprospiraceae bacterium]MBK9222394.1 T9SS type A sorting domain-containing protein [Saprospiraceae bacterium]